MRRLARFLLNVAPMLAFAAATVQAQGVTTGSMSGVITSNGAPAPGVSVIALHVESGSRYAAVTRDDGRYTISAMRVGGPYRVSVSRIGFQRQRRDSVFITLGQATPMNFDLKSVAVQIEEVTVSGIRDPVMSPDRTGAATTVQRDAIAAMPTISGRLDALVRLTPQAGGTSNPYSFVGQDPRMNNITVDGSYFNNSFGLGNTPGDRTGVAPISLNAVEQVQISVSPFDVRQGNFVGANVNTVTRSGTNQFKGSFLYQTRNQNYIGTKAGANPFDPGLTKYHNIGGWASGPIIPNKLFFFFNYEDDAIEQPGTTFRANLGSETATGSVTRVKASDLDGLATFLQTNFKYAPGAYQGYNNATPAKRLLGKVDYNVNDQNKLSLRYIQLDSKTDVLLSNSSSLGFGNRRSSTFGLNYQASNYNILENIKSLVGELNTSFGNGMTNQLIAGYTTNDESRGALETLFPFVDILESGSVYTSFGSEPFTPNNELRYHTAQFQNTLSIFRDKHTWSVGVSAERYHSENVFFPGSQSAYVYNSLADYYADANGYIANPNRTTSPVTLRRFQVRYMNIPGATKPVQPLDVTYAGIYAQDEWTPTPRLTLDIGARIDVPRFDNTAYDNPNVDKLVFRDENGNAVQYNSGALPKATPLFSPRLGFNWDANGDRTMQFRGGVGIFTGKPAYVWISNQIGNTGVLTGFDQLDNTTARPWNPDPNAYKPKGTPTGAPAASVDLAVTDQNFKFPQIWRGDIAVDKRLPWDLVGTGEFIYNHDLNGVYYINANLPAAQSAFVGADARPRWTGTSCNAPTPGPCVTRLNNTAGNVITNAIVLKNQSVGYSWNSAFSLERAFSSGFSAKAAYSYGVARNTVDPGSIASGSWSSNAVSRDPNNPGVGYSQYSPGHRLFLTESLRRNWFGFGNTTITAFTEWATPTNFSYIFSGDANGDGNTSNDLLYVPKDTSEMYFQQYTQGTGATAVTFTVDQQKQAWEKFIQQDDYLSAHRGQYAEKNAVFMPIVMRTDLSISQEISRQVGGRTNGLEVRFDVLNFGNLLNHNWGVGQRIVTTSPLTTPGADAQGRLAYRLRNINNQLVDHTYDPSVGLGDVYRLQLSLRYNFY